MIEQKITPFIGKTKWGEEVIVKGETRPIGLPKPLDHIGNDYVVEFARDSGVVFTANMNKRGIERVK